MREDHVCQSEELISRRSRPVRGFENAPYLDSPMLRRVLAIEPDTDDRKVAQEQYIVGSACAVLSVVHNLQKLVNVQCLLFSSHLFVCCEA